MQAAIGENNSLQFSREKLLGYARGFIQVAAADAEVAIDHRRIVENEKFFGGGRAIFLNRSQPGVRSIAKRVRRDWRWWPSSR